MTGLCLQRYGALYSVAAVLVTSMVSSWFFASRGSLALRRRLRSRCRRFPVACARFACFAFAAHAIASPGPEKRMGLGYSA